MHTKATGAFFAGACAGLMAVASPAQARESGEAQLARMLEGRVAGPAENCIADRSLSGLTVIDRTALVYRDGARLWVNRTSSPEALQTIDVPVFKKFGSARACRHDTITFVDRTSGIPGRVVFLGEFIPYTKPR